MIVAILATARDGVVLGRVIVWSALAQCVIAGAELAGGPAVRALFSPHYEIVVGGVQVAVTQSRLDAVSGTFNNYNDLSICLVTACVTLVALGSERMGWSRRQVAAMLTACTAVVLVSGSREGVFALAVGVTWMLQRRGRLPVFLLLAIVALGGLWAAPVIASHPRPGTAAAASPRAGLPSSTLPPTRRRAATTSA